MSELPRVLAQLRSYQRYALDAPVLLADLDRIEAAAREDGIEFPPKDGETHDVELTRTNEGYVLTFYVGERGAWQWQELHLTDETIGVLRGLARAGKL